jgi:4,5-DOPA dioxygenase extradiol
MSIDPFGSPDELIKIGQALRNLDDETAFIFSGGLVHNLAWLSFSGQIEPQAHRFWVWLNTTLLAKDTEGLLHYQKQTDAALAVPRPEHFAGIFCVYGTIDDKGSVSLIKHMFQYGTLSLDYYVFTKN